MFLLVLLVLYVFVVAALAYGGARLLTLVFPRLRVVIATVVIALSALALTPIPIHGGFLFLLPELFAEGRKKVRTLLTERQEARQELQLASRFAGYLDRPPRPPELRDPTSGLIWSEAVGRVSTVDPAALAEAKQLCARLDPPGYWALPRDVDFYFLARTGHASGSWLAEIFILPGEISLPSLVTLPGPPAGSPRLGQEPSRRQIGVRCVAITPPAPRRGYLSDDVPRADWNRYQLSRLSGDAGTR